MDEKKQSDDEKRLAEEAKRQREKDAKTNPGHGDDTGVPEVSNNS